MKMLTVVFTMMLVAVGTVHASDLTIGPYRVSLAEETGSISVKGAYSDVAIRMCDRDAPLKTDRLDVASETDGEIILRIGAGEIEGQLSFRPDGTITFVSDGAASVTFDADLAFGIVPGFFLVDVIHNLKKTNMDRIHVPSENVVVGLLDGGHAMLVCSWPKGEQKVGFTKASSSERASLWIETGGLPVHFALFDVPGIWHQWKYNADDFEKDTTLDWRKPFDAEWKTDLLLADVPLAFTGREERSSRSWPGIGRAVRPFWFEADTCFLRVGGRIQPASDVVIYPLRGHEKTPISFMERCSVETAELVKDRYQTRSYPPSGRTVPNVGFGACWGSALLQTTIYQSGAQSRDVDFLKNHIQSRIASVLSETHRHQEYLAFADAQLAQVRLWQQKNGNVAALSAFLEEMETLLISQKESHHQHMRGKYGDTAEAHIQFAFNLEERVFYLLDQLTGVNNEYFPEFAHIMGQYRGLRSVHERMGMQFGQNMRRLYHAAGQRCAEVPEAVVCAEAIRAAIREEMKCRRWETGN